MYSPGKTEVSIGRARTAPGSNGRERTLTFGPGPCHSAGLMSKLEGSRSYILLPCFWKTFGLTIITRATFQGAAHAPSY